MLISIRAVKDGPVRALGGDLVYIVHRASIIFIYTDRNLSTDSSGILYYTRSFARWHQKSNGHSAITIVCYTNKQSSR